MGSEEYIVKAGPTKEFFVSMITRDIQLPDAIVELIDNSIDGIKRQKAENYNNFFINVTFNKDLFEIEDNCGGIRLSIATEYAFVFGKPQTVRDKEPRAETTGTFGIGMKRALFKMGQNFNIVSISPDSHFSLNVDVQEWMKQSEWDFTLDEPGNNEINPIDKCGTKICVTNLFPGIAKSFNYTAFINEVINIVQRRTNAELTKGLNVTINGTKLSGASLSIINGGGIFPYKFTFESNNVRVMVLAGVSAETDPDKAGWYVFCNNREVLSADKSSLTTWKDDKDTSGIKYHNDFATFRGFVFFTSIFPEQLPWNTSKTGIDSSSEIYKEAKPHMVDAFKAISTELRKLAGLEEEIRGVITQKLRANSKILVHYYTALNIPDKTSILFIDSYTRQIEQEAASKPMTSISYRADQQLVEKIKSMLGVSTNRDVGIKTFEYFIEAEELEDA